MCLMQVLCFPPLGYYLKVDMNQKDSEYHRTVLRSRVFAQPPLYNQNSSSPYYQSCQVKIWKIKLAINACVSPFFFDSNFLQVAFTKHFQVTISEVIVRVFTPTIFVYLHYFLYFISAPFFLPYVWTACWTDRCRAGSKESQKPLDEAVPLLWASGQPGKYMASSLMQNPELQRKQKVI